MNYKKLDLTKHEGLEVEIKLEHKIKGSQYARFELDELTISGWFDDILGKRDKKIKKTIKEAFLVQHNNGGRKNDWKAKTYKKYFNDEVKQAVIAKRSAGMMGSLMMGDVESADIIVYFTDGTKIDSMQFINCPEEWYSEQYKDKGDEMIERGFYKTAEKAVEAQKNVDDMFGERYFPVVAFPKKVTQKTD